MVADSFLRQFVQAEWESFPCALCPDHRRGRARRGDVGCAHRAVSHRLVCAARRDRGAAQRNHGRGRLSDRAGRTQGAADALSRLGRRFGQRARSGRGEALVRLGAAGAEISSIEIDAAAPSLDGPAHLDGQFSGPDNAPVAFRLASEKPGPAGTPLRLSVDAGPRWAAAEFDGALEGDPAAGLGGLRFAGAATLTGTAPGEEAPTPGRVAGPMTVDLDQAPLRQAEFRLGPE